MSAQRPSGLREPEHPVHDKGILNIIHQLCRQTFQRYGLVHPISFRLPFDAIELKTNDPSELTLCVILKQSIQLTRTRKGNNGAE